MLRYREHAPAAPLAPWVDRAWAIGPGAPVDTHRVLPDGCIDVIWSSSMGLTVVGPMTRGIVAPLGAHSRVAGIRFLPGGAPALLGVRAEELLDARIPVADLLGDEGRRLEDEVEEDPARVLAKLRRFVARRAAGAPRPDPLVRAAATRLAVGAPLTGLPGSERTLRRRVTAEVGFGPKRLARVLRLRRALAVAPADGLAGAALRAGYTDQSHFTNDCVDLAGVTPGRFLQDVAA